MKSLFYAAIALFFSVMIASCGETDVVDYTPAPGDAFCTYDATGATNVPFRVCVLCPTGAAICGTIKEVRILREHNWITPNKYDYYSLTPVAGATGCSSCTGQYYWKKE